MPIYTQKPDIIELHQWFKNGDHPKDGVINHLMNGRVVCKYKWKYNTDVCVKCGVKMHLHGLLVIDVNGHENVLVHPGDYIQTIYDNRNYVKGYIVRSRKEIDMNYVLELTEEKK